MEYYTSVFCKSEEIPSIKKIMSYVNTDYEDAYTNLSEKKLEAQNWTAFELFYDKAKSPVIVEIYKVDNSRKLAKEEIEAFKELIGKPKLLETKKRKVIKHLNKTKYIICNQLLTEDIDEEGHEINWCVLSFFESNYDGIIYADGEGIYIDEKYLIVIE